MRVYKRINDVYEVELPDCKKHFQFLQSDSALLGGDVIAIFNEKYEHVNDPSFFVSGYVSLSLSRPLFSAMQEIVSSNWEVDISCGAPFMAF